jgi:flagellar hook-length control protein FliK
LAAANQAQATNAQSATQTAAEAPAQAAAASTTAQASLDAGVSPNPEASTSVGASPNSGASPLPVPGVPMQEMIDSIGATIELAARQGIAKARIELQPEELGHISIRLSQTSEGLRARVTADTPAGAQALNQGRSELRQSLSSLGLSLLQLDIGSSGQPQTGEEDGRFATNADGSSAGGATGTAEESEALAEPRDNTRPAGTPLGEIVDVLA